MPTVSWRPVSMPRRSLVPPPSVPETSTGLRKRSKGPSTSAPKPPMPPSTSRRMEGRTPGLILSTNSSPAAMSTPPSRQVTGARSIIRVLKQQVGRRGRWASCSILHEATTRFRDYSMAQFFGNKYRRYLRLAVILCLSAVVGLPGAVLGLTRVDLFQAQAPLDGRSEVAQTAAFQAAMRIVLVRVTGRRTADED